MSQVVAVCAGAICRARSAPIETFREVADDVAAEVAVLPCLRACWVGPIVGVFDGDARTVLYEMHGDRVGVMDRLRSACSNTSDDQETAPAYDPSGSRVKGR